VKTERQRFPAVSPHKQSPEPRDHANGQEAKSAGSRLGRINFSAPKVRNSDSYPQSLDKGARSERALTFPWQRGRPAKWLPSARSSTAAMSRPLRLAGQPCSWTIRAGPGAAGRWAWYHTCTWASGTKRYDTPKGSDQIRDAAVIVIDRDATVLDMGRYQEYNFEPESAIASSGDLGYLPSVPGSC
jgi:hypothetical protein